jgi:hypothetical protein
VRRLGEHAAAVGQSPLALQENVICALKAELSHKALVLPYFALVVGVLGRDLRHRVFVGLGMEQLCALEIAGAVEAIIAVIFRGHVNAPATQRELSNLPSSAVGADAGDGDKLPYARNRDSPNRDSLHPSDRVG